MSDAEAPGTEAPEAQSQDQAYFRAVEEIFIGLRGSPLLLSPADWQVAKRWRRRGIPLEIVRESLEELFRRREESGALGKIRSLRYCSSAVEEAWEEVEALGAVEERSRPLPLDIEARLLTLAKALPESTPDRLALADAVRFCAGGAARVEERLAELDRQMMARAEETLDDEGRRRLGREAEEILSGVGARLSEEELALSRARLRRQILRRRLGLPLLSLFSPEAVG